MDAEKCGGPRGPSKFRNEGSVSASGITCATAGSASPSGSATQRTDFPDAEARLAQVCLVQCSLSGRSPNFKEFRQPRTMRGTDEVRGYSHPVATIYYRVRIRPSLGTALASTGKRRSREERDGGARACSLT